MAVMSSEYPRDGAAALLSNHGTGHCALPLQVRIPLPCEKPATDHDSRSDRCAPRPYRHTNGYGSHTYNFNREVAGCPLPSGRPRLPRWSDTTNGAGCAWGAAPSPDHLKKAASNHQSIVRRPFSSTTGAWAPEETVLPLQLTGDGLQRRQVNGRRDRVVWRHAATERSHQITLIWLAEREAV